MPHAITHDTHPHPDPGDADAPPPDPDPALLNALLARFVARQNERLWRARAAHRDIAHADHESAA
jgi:hypothetical protein